MYNQLMEGQPQQANCQKNKITEWKQEKNTAS